MTPKSRKVILITGVSLGIIAFSFLVPTVILPTVISVQRSINCWNAGCTGTTYQKCVAKQGNGTSSGPWEFMTNGVQGLRCMMGPSQFDTYFYFYSSPVLSTELEFAFFK